MLQSPHGKGSAYTAGEKEAKRLGLREIEFPVDEDGNEVNEEEQDIEDMEVDMDREEE